MGRRTGRARRSGARDPARVRNDMGRARSKRVAGALRAAIAGAAWLIASGPAMGQPPAAPGAPEALDLSGLAPGPVVVVLRTGERLRGEFVEKRGGSLVVRIAGIETGIPIDQIDRVVAQSELVERYRALRAGIADNDAERLLFLAEWLRMNGMLDEARQETRTALDADPTNGEGIRLRQLIEEQIRLREKTRVGADNGAGGGEDRPANGPATRPLPGQFPLLTEEQANLLKVYEINLDAPARILISRDAMDQLLDRYAGRLDVPATREGRAAFLRRTPAEILDTMFRLRARELYGEVQVQGLPASLERCRDDVHAAWLVNGCATTRCHGGDEAGRLMLYNRRPTAEQSALTNFLILDRFRLPDGRALINYDAPAQSPLLQMALPPDRSASPHPRVEGWTPIFTDDGARPFEAAVEWIRSMYQPRPEVPIEYQAPAGKGKGPEAPTAPPEPLEEGPVER